MEIIREHVSQDKDEDTEKAMPITQDQAREKIGELIEKYRTMTVLERKEISESSVVHQFLDPFLEALGWPVQDPSRYKYEPSTQVGRPDMILLPEQGGTIFVEAKRFGIIGRLELARSSIAAAFNPGQMALPGMATDRTNEEQQAINYAFGNGGTWAILTNFEKLRLFNARRDWLVLSFEEPSGYLTDFDLLWQLSYENVCAGGLELMSNQRHREDVDTDYLNFINTWREKLAQDIISHPENSSWVFASNGLIDVALLRAVVQRILDRLVVLRFAEDHIVVPPNTLYSLYELRKTNPYTHSLEEMFRQLYRRVDEDHNSALFAPHIADVAVLSDEVLAGLVQKLYEARYRAMSADIMGNTYEQYLGKTLAQKNGNVISIDNLETRKKQGSYYTPQVIVRYIVDNTLGRYLYGTSNGQYDGDILPDEHRKTAADIRELRILDPASGSGSFLIYAYQILADFYRNEMNHLEMECEQRRQELAREGTTRPLDIQIELTPWTAEIERLRDYPRIILETHLYGVDLDPQAAEIATVNLVMRAMADQRKTNKRLPLILNQNVKVGNSLIGVDPADARYENHASDLAELRRLRLQLLNETDSSNHEETLTAIDEISGRVNTVLNETVAEHFGDTVSRTPFNWAVEFPEVFTNEQGQHLGETAGFHIIIGNPPWEIVKPDLREFYAQFDPDIESRLNRRQTETRIAQLNVEDPAREVAWELQKAKVEETTAYLHNSPDYSQQGGGDTATHKLFLERGYHLLKQSGQLSFVIPSGIYTDLGTKQLREMILNDGQILFMFSFSNERYFFPYVHHAFKFTLLGTQKGLQSAGFWAAFRFNPRVAVSPDELFAFLGNRDNLVYMRRESLERFSPDSLSVMEFQTNRDYEVTEKIYSNWPLLGEHLSNTWNVRFTREYDMTNSRELFNVQGASVPLYEGKMIHQFDAYFAEPQYLLRTEDLQYTHARLGVRAIAASTNERTLIASMLPPMVGAGNSILTIVDRISSSESVYLMGVLNSFILDSVLRMKVTSNINMFFLYQLPVPRLSHGNPYFDIIASLAAKLTCITPDFAEVWQDIMGEAWDESNSVTNPAERQALRDELDALVAHLYNLSRDEFAHIFNTFPLVFSDDDAGNAKKEALLSVYDRFAVEVKDWERS